jgi:hypothetical protein
LTGEESINKWVISKLVLSPVFSVHFVQETPALKPNLKSPNYVGRYLKEYSVLICFKQEGISLQVAMLLDHGGTSMVKVHIQ